MSRRKKSEFLKWRERYGVTVADAASLFDVCERTVRNWDDLGAPALAMRLIALFQRDLSGLHPDWKGWKLSHTGKLHGPGRIHFSARQLSALPSLVRDLDARVCSIEAQERERLRVRRRLLLEAFDQDERERTAAARQALLSFDLAGF